MNTLQNSANEQINGGNEKFIGNEAASTQQFTVLEEFFKQIKEAK